MYAFLYKLVNILLLYKLKYKPLLESKRGWNTDSKSFLGGS